MRLTDPQLDAMSRLLHATEPMSSRSLSVRADVLWRLAGMGLARQNIAEDWSITIAGERALGAHDAR